MEINLLSSVIKHQTNFYNVRFYGILPSNSSAINGTNFYKLIQKVEEAGGGVIYFPSGVYNINNTNDYIITTSYIKFLGDGECSRINKYGKNPLIHVVGKSIKNTANTSGHVFGLTIDSLWINNSQSYTTDMKPLVDLEAVSVIRINNCLLRGSGTHLNLTECFDSKIISTDFTESGRSYKASTDIADDFVDYTNRDNDDYTPTIMFNSNITSYNQEGYETDGLTIENTNQIMFLQCRFESYYGGAVGLNGNGTNNIYFTNCKFESKQCRVPVFNLRYYWSSCFINSCVFCKYIYTSVGDRSEKPVLYSDSLFVGNKINATVSLQRTSTSYTQRASLFKVLQNTSSSFSMNEFDISCRINDGAGLKMIDDTAYIIESGIPHELFLNGNKTTVEVSKTYGNKNNDYEELSPITSIPTERWHTKGERLNFTYPDTNGNTEAICTVSGTPGTWVLK